MQSCFAGNQNHTDSSKGRRMVIYSYKYLKIHIEERFDLIQETLECNNVVRYRIGIAYASLTCSLEAEGSAREGVIFIYIIGTPKAVDIGS